MPTKTFYNLPQEKKKKLLEAIQSELSRVPFADISINRIVQQANIARGSYYQYFESKDDLFELALTDYRELIQERSKECLLKNGGDIFITIENALDATVDYCMHEERRAMFVNLFSHLRVRDTIVYKQKCGMLMMPEMMELIQFVNMETLTFRDKEKFMSALEILLSLFRAQVAEVFANPESAEDCKQRFHEKIEILQHGMIACCIEGDL